jgi:hypothetical protein
MIGASAHRVPEILTLKNAASVPEAARRGPRRSRDAYIDSAGTPDSVGRRRTL